MGSNPPSDPLAKIKQKFHQEILALAEELSVDLPKEIAKARAHGDLKENSEYKYAKQRQRQVRGRLRFLKRRMGDICVSDLSNLPKDRVGYGSRVLVLDLKKSVEVEFRIVIAEEADASKGMITAASPIGKALLNHKVGDQISVETPAGVKEFKLLRLKTIYEEE
jgi:transcription elongation factor GreA